MSQRDGTHGFLVTGRVQGVGFRWWTCRLGTELGLDGAVRNRYDGSVEIRVRGKDAAVEEFRRGLGVGPRGARVEGIEECESDLRLSAGRFEAIR